MYLPLCVTLASITVHSVLGTVSSVCNQELTATEIHQNITSPGYPNGYSSNLLCNWRIHSANGNRVRIDVIDSGLGFSDCVKAFDGNTSSAEIILKWCGQLLLVSEPKLISSGSSMFLVFQTHESVSKRGFVIEYYEETNFTCGGKLTAGNSFSLLKSPGYPANYPNKLNCTWTITAQNTNEMIMIKQIMADFEQTVHCGYDSITVKSGSKMLGKFCDSFAPVYGSPNSQMSLTFKSDASITSRGFLIFYKSIAVTPCHGAFTATSTPKNFTSPGYPWHYTDSLRCSWTIQAADLGRRVVIEVIDSVIEKNDQCSFDHVTAYDGSSTDKDELQKWCGEERPKLVSASNSLSVALWTDNSNVYKGFLIRYYETDVSTCGGTLIATETLSNLTSPNYPNVYPANTTCVWKIIAENQNGRVSIVSSDFHLEPQIDCSYDSLTIRDGSKTNSLLGVFCGTRGLILTSSGRHLFLVFRTDSSNSFQGFRIGYKSVQSSRGENLLMATKKHSFLRSPGYPNRQVIGINFLWLITAPEGKRIKVNARDVDVGHRIPCTTNNGVTIYNGPSVTSRILATWCMTNTSSVTSTSNVVTIFFNANTTLAGIRSMVEFYTDDGSANCGGPLRASNVYNTFTSPGYPLSYSNNMHCSWTISATNSNDLISINVIDSQTEHSSDCRYDSVTVFDSTSSRILQKFCGSTKPKIVSPRNSVSIVFHSDSSNSDKGFKIEYHQISAISDSFNSHLYANYEGGLLMSPGYPNFYPNNMDCSWRITAMDDGENVQVNVLVSNIEASGCIYDYVKVFDGSSVYSTKLGTFCAQASPTYTSTASDILIKFHTDDSRAYTGFKIAYKQVSQGRSTGNTGCNAETAELTATYLDQYIESPNYPGNYPNNADCSWRITTDISHNVIQLDVISSNLECDSDCPYDYVEAFDGYDDSSASLGKWCCGSIPTYESSGQQMFVKFHSDESNTDSGFRIKYTKEYKSHYYTAFSSNAGPIAGGIIGSIAFITLVACIVTYCSRRNNHYASTRLPSNIRGQRNVVFVVGEGNHDSQPNLTMFAASPPPYSVATSKEYQENFSPPPYQPNPGVSPAQAQTNEDPVP